MIKEIRGADFKVISGNEDENIRYAIGTEGCVNKFCYDIEAIIDQDISINNKVTIVTPRVMEHYMERVINDIIKINNKYDIEYIVVNDYGVLHSLSKYNFNNIIIGRTLVRSLFYTPWNGVLLQDEDEDVKNNLLMHNAVHESKFSFFSQYGVVGFELCYVTNIEKSIDIIHQHGYIAFYHHDDVIATIGRTCPIARMYNERASDCTRKCSEIYTLDVNRVWGNNGVVFCKINEDTKKVFPTFYNRENVFYYKTTDDIVPDADVVVYTCYFSQN